MSLEKTPTKPSPSSVTAAMANDDDCDGLSGKSVRERAQRNAKSDDANAFALQLLIAKALDENGQKLFSPGEVDVLKNEVKDKDLQALMLAILSEDDAASMDPKS